MKLEPYIFFYGRCAEALEFYKKVLGGEYNAIPFEDDKRVMHADFKGNGFAFMASDGPPGKTVDPDAGNIALSLELSTAAEGKRVFDALAEGGKVSVPLGDVEWGGGGKFGIIADRFGTEWMISSPQ